MNNIKFLVAAGLVAAPFSSFAQKGVEDGSKYGHGQDSVVCIDNLVKYSDLVKANNLKDAYEPWKIVFEQCPLAHGANLYINGVKIVKNQIKVDPANKDAYVDLLMAVYDQRAKYFGNNKKTPASYIMGTKAVDLITLKGDAATDDALALLDKAMSGAPASIQASFVQYYMTLVVKKFKAQAFSADQVVDAYVRCSELLPQMEAVATEKTKPSIVTTKESVEGIFAQSGAADCGILTKVFQPQLASNLDNSAWLKKVSKLLSNADCTESEFFYAISEALHKVEPQAASARGLAKMYLKQGDASKALSFYDEAIKLEDDAKLKARYYYEMALVYYSQNSYSAAKSACLNAAANREGWGDPYILLAKVYAAGARGIGEKDWEKRAGFWAAVDKAQKAKNVDSSESVQKEANELIRQYSQQFPSKQDLFFDTKADGDSYFVGGFISETTTVRSKK